MSVIASVALGFLLDLALGDPRWLPHPVVLMGRAISWLEPRLRGVFGEEPSHLRWAGRILVLVMVLGAYALSWALLAACGLVGPWLRFVVETWLCYQVLAACELRRQTMAVAERLRAHDLAGARTAVSMVVGRDVSVLDEAGVARAAVETVAENSSDGVIAPLLYLVVGGAPLGLAYKAANTMDSMVGYKNERYLDFGRCAALFDDLVNWVPARLAGLFVICGAYLSGLDGAGALRFWKLQRTQSESPNAAQTESAMAGALGIHLNGDAVYFGKVVHKPQLGVDLHEVGPDDIERANRLMYAGVCCALVVALLARAAVIWLGGWL